MQHQDHFLCFFVTTLVLCIISQVLRSWLRVNWNQLLLKELVDIKLKNVNRHY